MLIVDVVLDISNAAGFTSWPIINPPADGLLCLSGQMTPAEVGTAIAVIAAYNYGPENRDVEGPDGMALLAHAVQAEALIAPGGLRLHETTANVSVSPGCCCGLEDWREWLDLLAGGGLWLGHDPSPRIDRVGDAFHLWPDGAGAAASPSGPPIKIQVTEVPTLLSITQRKLRGFLDVVTTWTHKQAPMLTNGLIAALDEHLRITCPLETT